MKLYINPILSAAVLVLTLLSCGQNSNLEYVIENTNDFATEYASLTIPFNVNDFPTYFKIVDENENEIPYQLDDIDQDGAAEILFLQISLDANSSSTISVVETESTPDYVAKSDITIKVRDQKDPDNMQVSDDFKSVDQYTETFDFKQDNGLIFLEGPGWESDLVGYRLYFDDRNRIDIFGKSTNELALNDISETYHERRAWGADILKVSSSLGIGTPALFVDNKFFTIENTGTKSMKIISDGPLRSILEITYPDWEVNSQTSDVLLQLEIHANHRYTELRLKTDLKNAEFATGLVMHPAISEIITEASETYTYGYTWGDQTDQDETLGMAIIIPQRYSPDYKGELQESYVFSLKNSNSDVAYRFLGAWELEPESVRINSETDFVNYVDQIGKQWQAPLKVTKK